MNTRTIAVSTILASLLALAGCTQGTLPGAQAASAPHPVLGFASPGAGSNATAPSPRFEEDRMVQRPVVMSDEWATTPSEAATSMLRREDPKRR
jgi:hypothetical protein